jgi:acyl carrier protein
MQPQPIGVVGELYIGGDQLARGYMQRPELDELSFTPNPFDTAASTRLYRSGDLARFRADGAIEYIGRYDSQVKIRGQRIELGEIDAVLERLPSVLRTVTIVREDRSNDQRLIAYICFKDGESMSNSELRNHLREHLPRYMIPQLFVELDTVPLTSSGKVNRKALPEPFQSVDKAQQHKPPTTETERQIASIWRELLRIEEFGVDQHFFDIGGHSLLALDSIYRLEKLFGVRITAMDMLLNSLQQIAAQIDQHLAIDANAVAVGQDNHADEGNIIRRLFNKKKTK